MVSQTLEVNGVLVRKGVEEVINTAGLSDDQKREIERLQATHELYDLYAPAQIHRYCYCSIWQEW
jgi:hypothetical protein